MKTRAIRTQKEAFVELITVTQLIKVPLRSFRTDLANSRLYRSICFQLGEELFVAIGLLISALLPFGDIFEIF